MSETQTRDYENQPVKIKLSDVLDEVTRYLQQNQTYFEVIYTGDGMTYRLQYNHDTGMLEMAQGKNTKLVTGNRPHAIELTLDAIQKLNLDVSRFVQPQPAAEEPRETETQVPVNERLFEVGQYLKGNHGRLTASYREYTGLPLRLDPERGHVQVGLPTHGGGTNWTLVNGGKRFLLEPQSVAALDAFTEQPEKSDGSQGAPQPSRVFKEIGGKMLQVLETKTALERVNLPDILNVPGVRREFRLLQIELADMKEKPEWNGIHFKLFSEMPDAARSLKTILEALKAGGYAVIHNYRLNVNPSMILIADERGQVSNFIERIVRLMHASEEFKQFLNRCRQGAQLNLLIEVEGGRKGDPLDNVNSATVVAM